MFNPKQFLKLSIDPKLTESNQSTMSATSAVSAISENSVTLNTYTATPNTPSSINDSQYSDIFQSTESLPPPQFDNKNQSNSQYNNISKLSLSSLPSIANGPHLSNNITNHSNNSRHSHSNQSSSHTIHLNLSETTLTPNLAATANLPNTFITNDDNFSLDTINTASQSEDNSNAQKPIISCKDKTDKMYNNMENKENIPANKDNNADEKTAEPVMTMIDGDGDDDDDEHILTDIMNDVVDIEEMLLKKHGYKRGKKIATTLQGFIYELESIKDGTKYVLKKTSKHLHSAGITIQNGKKYAVKEDILNEKAILELLNKQKAPQFMIKFVEFFESHDYYYLVMEHGGSDLFEFIISAHKHIQNGKLSIKEWRKFIKYIFWQMCVLLLWLHNTGNACHLDVSLENLLVQNAKFIDHGNGQLTIATNLQIKFCDFGLAEFYDVDDSNLDTAFMSTKYCGKTNYKSPQVYFKKGEFDGRKADVWSLGVVLFCMAVGAPPYKKPNKEDQCYWTFIRKGHIAQLLYQWKRHHYVTERMLSLMKCMLEQDENKRYSVDDIVQHPWLRTYFARYKSLIMSDLLSTKFNKK